MADKEERIFIRKGTARELCKFIYRDGCAGEMHCCSCAISIPISEVIERMAKAIYTFEIVACSHDECGNKQCENCETWKWCENIAEAALNALLEDKK